MMENTPGKEPAVISTSLQNTTLISLLQVEFKTKISSGIPENSVIFPVSRLACLIIDSSNPSFLTSTNNIVQFVKGNANGHIVFVSTNLNYSEIECFQQKIQEAIPDFDMPFLVASHLQEATRVMAQLANVFSVSKRDTVQQYIDESSASVVTDEARGSFLALMGLTQQEANILYDAFGSVAAVLEAKPEELVDYIDRQSVTQFHLFFRNTPQFQ